MISSLFPAMSLNFGLALFRELTLLPFNPPATLRIKITTRLTTIDSKTWSMVFPVSGEHVAELLSKQDDRRVICTLSNGYQWHCALLPDGRDNYFINVSKNVQKAGELIPEAPLEISLQPDQSEYGMPVPEELIELWAFDQEAMEVFQQLTPGKQRTLLYRIGQPKTSDTRAKRAVQFMEYLKQTKGVLDYKELNIFIKNWE